MIEEYLSWINYSGVALVVASVVYIWLATRRRNWPSTHGKIVRSGATQEVNSTTYITDNSYRPVSKMTSINYTPHLEYHYEVNGVTYSAKKLYSVNVFPITTTDILPIICGSTRKVFFNPNNPRKSYLVRSPLILPVAIFVVGGLLAGFNSEWIELINVIWQDLLQAYPSQKSA